MGTDNQRVQQTEYQIYDRKIPTTAATAASTTNMCPDYRHHAVQRHRSTIGSRFRNTVSATAAGTGDRLHFYWTLSRWIGEAFINFCGVVVGSTSLWVLGCVVIIPLNGLCSYRGQLLSNKANRYQDTPIGPIHGSCRTYSQGHTASSQISAAA